MGDRTKNGSYVDPKGKDNVKEILSEPGNTYTNLNGKIELSKNLEEAIIKRLETKYKLTKGKDFTTHEIMQAVRALDAVGNKDAFGFFRGESGEEKHLRPTHKRDGAPQHGQIDSSLTFNVATVLFRRSIREAELTGEVRADKSFAGKSDKVQAEVKKRLDKETPESDIKLSDAGSMATFVKVIQSYSDKGRHIFGATGTTGGLKGLTERVIGRKVVDVDASSYGAFKTYREHGGKNAVDGIYENKRQTNAEANKTVDLVDMDRLSTREVAGDIIQRSTTETLTRNVDKNGQTVTETTTGTGIIIGSPKEAALVEALIGYVSKVGDAKTVQAVVKAIGEAGGIGKGLKSRKNSGSLRR